MAIFPVISQEKKTVLGEEAFNSNGLIQRIVREIKKEDFNVGIITDVALDPYTNHGQDGILKKMEPSIMMRPLKYSVIRLLAMPKLEPMLSRLQT